MGGKRTTLEVAKFLRPQEKVVPFLVRPELDELLSWCATGGHSAIWLVTGDGGAGKTRLALRLCDKLTASGWQPLWVPRGSEREALQAKRLIGQPYVLVVDYAETRGELADWLNAVAADKDGPDLRVLLLARSAGEWWQRLLASVNYPAAELLEASLPVRLGPVRVSGGPQEVFADALTAFARKLGVARPDATLALADPDPVVLVVHAAALLAVVDHATGAPPANHAASGSQVLEGLLRHEARYWAGTAAGRGLNLDLSVLRLAVAVAGLIGADSETSAATLLSRVPDLHSAKRRGQVARWLHDLYPVSNEGDMREREWLGPLRPDRLAEQLVAGELQKRSDLIPRLFSGLGEARAARALTVLARAALTQEFAAALLGHALVSDLEHLAVPALSVAVETNPIVGDLLGRALDSQLVSRETLIRVADACPYPSFALAGPAAAVLKRLADQSADEGERAGRLGSLSNRLADLGRREDALAAAEEAVSIYRQLAVAGADAFTPELAMSLSNLSNRLADLGRREDALAAVVEAVTVYRPLAAARPVPFIVHLARSLNNLSLRLADLGRREDALAPIVEAVSVYRQLATPGTDAFTSELATSLNNLSNRLADLGRREEALASIEEAVSVCRELATARPDAFTPDLARLLNNLSAALGGLGRREEALAAIEEATSVHRQLATARPDAFTPELARSLDNLAAALRGLGRREAALAASGEAVAIYRQLAAARPDAFTAELARSLSNLSLQLADLGGREEALAASGEAVAIYRQLAAARPDVFTAELARSLSNLSLQLADLGGREEALAAAEEAVSLGRQLVAARLDASTPDLTGSLDNLALALAGSVTNRALALARLGRGEEALADSEEVTRLFRQLAADRPDAFTPDLATSLNNLSFELAGLARWEEALAAAGQAVAIYRQLVAARPDAFTAELARSLDNLSVALTGLSRWEDALAASVDAVSLYRQLAAARPDAFTPDLARSLNNLAVALARLGRSEEALAAAEEAAALRRQFVAAQPDAFTRAPPSSASIWPGTPEEAIESALRAEAQSDPEHRVREAVRSADIYVLGQPAGDTSVPGEGTEGDLLHFTRDDDAGAEVDLLPVFTNLTTMREALIRNPEWQTLSVLQISGGALLDNVDDDVTIVINPWTDLEYQLLPR